SARRVALERKVVHRDVKLSNILRTGEGVVKLTDFGLAKPAGEDASLTGRGNVVGTIAYLAPEVLGGKAADHRADMYALGIVLHELVAGKSPFDDTPGAHLRRDALPPLDAVTDPLRAI